MLILTQSSQFHSSINYFCIHNVSNMELLIILYSSCIPECTVKQQQPVPLPHTVLISFILHLHKFPFYDIVHNLEVDYVSSEYDVVS